MFSLHAVEKSKDEVIAMLFPDYYGLLNVSITSGPALGVVVAAIILGMVGTIIILVMCTMATSGRDGPLIKILTLALPDPAPTASSAYPATATDYKRPPPPRFEA